MNSEARRGIDPAHVESTDYEHIPVDPQVDRGTAHEGSHLLCGGSSTTQRLNRSAVADGGLPSREEVADAIRACHADGLTHVKMRHICARLEDFERGQTGVAKSIGTHCSRFAERDALDQWSASRGGGRTVWEIVDVDKLPRRKAIADGGHGPDETVELRDVLGESGGDE